MNAGRLRMVLLLAAGFGNLRAPTGETDAIGQMLLLSQTAPASAPDAVMKAGRTVRSKGTDGPCWACTPSANRRVASDVRLFWRRGRLLLRSNRPFPVDRSNSNRHL
jgi:hypothetical protein